MSLNKKDRRISIWVGVVIGVAISSMLFKYAIKEKNNRAYQRSGSYDSNVTAIDGLPFPSVPDSILKVIPHGLVLYYESNFSISGNFEQANTDCWIIESSGALRSERLFVLIEINSGEKEKGLFYRASELYVSPEIGTTRELIEENLPESDFRVLGENKKTDEYIVQIKEFFPKKLSDYLHQMPKNYPGIKKVRLSPWFPSL